MERSTIQPYPPLPPAPPAPGVASVDSAEAVDPATHFPVVGLGASAGGLDAFVQLLEALPADTGMAFLLVQHMDPGHPSALPMLLSPRCAIPISEAIADEQVVANHAYVIPPNTTMTLSDGRLRLRARADDAGPHLPIDELFASLAEDRPGACMGVVLSGNGTDGTRGVEVIRAAGGLTFAQDEGTAAYPAMPRSAAASGCIDRVLMPAEIARALTELPLDGLKPVDGAGDGLAADTDLTALIALLHSRHAVDFGSYRATALERRIHRRMLLRNIRSYGEYAGLLSDDDAEIDALHDDILINVTSFFRDPAMYESLRTTVFPAIFRDRGSERPVRMWVPGCSTGQEVYSLLMAMLEFRDDRPDAPQIQVFATDLSERVALRRARAATYPQSIEAEVSTERLARFFVREEGGYRVGKELRETVVFARHDVTADAPFSHMDLCSCRNLLIYLAPPVQQRVIATLHYALNDGGFLVLGSAETVGGASDLFAVLDHRNRIYGKRGWGGRPRAFASPAWRETPARAGLSAPAVDWRAAADRVAVADCVPPSVLVNESLDVLEFRGDTAAYLAPPVGPPSNNLEELARDGLFLELRDAVHACRRTGAPVDRPRVSFRQREFDLRVLPVDAGATRERCFLILFSARPGPGAALRRVGYAIRARRWVPEWLVRWLGLAQPVDPEPARLRKELASTREYYQSITARHGATNDILSSANEEIVSGNEELQSTNEELETAKEELQSVNEELLTVNEQLQGRNVDLVSLSDDLTNLLGSAGVPMVAVDANLLIRRFTPAARDTLHLRDADRGQALDTVGLPIALDDLGGLCRRVMESATLSEREVRDKAGRWYVVRVHPYRTTDGTVDGVVVVLVDIDEAKHAQALLRDSRDYVTAIVDTVRQPLLVLDAGLHVQSANRSFHQRFGTDLARIEGCMLGELDVDWFQPYMQGLLRQVLYGDGVLVDHEVSVGGQTWLLNARRMVGAGAHRVLLAIEDVTEARRLSEALRKQTVDLAAADTRKNEFLAILAHELRNPLTPVRNALQIQRLSRSDPDSADRTLEMMERQVRHMTRLVDDLLDVSRIELGRIELRRRRVDLGAVVSQAVHMERPLVEVSGHQVEIDIPPEPVLLYADPVRIDQIVGNLFANAVKYTDPGGRIRLYVSRDGEAAVLEVVDSGVGISATMLPRIWDLFTQAEWTADRTRGGLGIGLALVKSLVQLHGGSVEAYSDGPGTGSRFVVRFGSSPASPTTIPRPATAAGRTSGPRPAGCSW